MRLNPLIPPEAGFLMLVAVVVFSTILAVAQDALVLAAAGAAGGFAAPILASTGRRASRRTVRLFPAARCRHPVGRPGSRPGGRLNLIGFVGTLGIGAAWAEQDYAPEMLTTTEPFLIAFFLMFVAIAVLFARRVLRDTPGEPPADGPRRAGAVGGAPVELSRRRAAVRRPSGRLALQAGLMTPYRYGLAFSALALGLFYMALAAALLSRTQRRYLALVEVFIALGVVFGTLTCRSASTRAGLRPPGRSRGQAIYWIASSSSAGSAAPSRRWSSSVPPGALAADRSCRAMRTTC
ncbi:MAG: DUF2339 domain-containing protein [Aliidongia sp.]